MKYTWIILLSISVFLFTSCQSVKDFFKIGEKSQKTEVAADLSSATSAAELLNHLPKAATVADRLNILQEAYTMALEDQDAEQIAYIVQYINIEVSALHVSVTPDYRHCELGENFNILVTVKSDSGLPIGSIPLNVLLDDGTLFDTIETGTDGIFFGEFRCGIASGTGEKQYCFILSLHQDVIQIVEADIPNCHLFLVADKMPVTADVKVAEELFSHNLVDMYSNFLDQQLNLNLVAPNTSEKFHVQMEIFTSEILKENQGYSADVSLAFYIADSHGVVIYDMETDCCHAVGASPSAVVEAGVSKLFNAIKQDASFISDFQSAFFKD